MFCGISLWTRKRVQAASESSVDSFIAQLDELASRRVRGAESLKVHHKTDRPPFSLLPSDDPDDYEFGRKPTIENDAGVSVDDDDWYDEDEEIDELDDFDISISRDSLFVECFYEGHPNLNTDMVVMDDETKEYSFCFEVYSAPRNKFRDVQMTLTPLQYWGTSSYPLLILRILENSQTPLDQQQIISRIESAYDTKIERKAIGRNVSLLKDLGYDIQHNGDGYFIPKKAPTLEQEDFQAIVESVNANESLDDERKRELIDKFFEV